MTQLCRILHVEDDPDIREIAALAMEMVGGFEIFQVGSGAEAIELAPRVVPDLFLLDVMMPGLGGEATFEALRAIPALSGIPAIFMTAKAQEADIQALRSLGAIGVIIKPFDPMTLADEIRALWQAAASG